MRKVIMIGCDLHDKAMLLKIAEGREEPETRSVKNTAAGRKTMIRDLKKRAVAASVVRIVFAYAAIPGELAVGCFWASAGTRVKRTSWG